MKQIVFEMKKHLILSLFLIITVVAFNLKAQIFANPNPGTYGVKFNRGTFGTALHIPTTGSTPSSLAALNSVLSKQAALLYDSTGHKLYVWDPAIALWKETDGGVPYIGATRSLDLGAHDLKVQNMTIGLGGGEFTTNTVIGYRALKNNVFGQENLAIGAQSLENTTEGSGNIAIGNSSLEGLTLGVFNIGIGHGAFSNITTGVNNIGIGIGINAINPSGNEQLNIGNWVYGKNGRISIGSPTDDSTNILQVNGGARIETLAGTGNRMVIANSKGELSTQAIPSVLASSMSYSIGASNFYSTSLRSSKTNIAPFTRSALAIINSVDVVEFNYKTDLDNKRIGFIADDTVEELATKNHNQMDLNSSIGVLIKAVQEQQLIINELQAQIQTLKK